MNFLHKLLTNLPNISAIILAGIFVILLFATPAPTSANGFCWWGLHPATAWKCAPEAVAEAAGGVAAQAMEWMIGIFNELLSKIVAFFAFVLNWTFDIQEITNIDVIQFAWSVSRDFANMFFILILLIIAFATILRYEPYGIKRLLPKLLLVALLINFSMVGAGLIIDLGSSLGHFFVTGGAYDESAGDIGANIAAAVGIQNLNNYEGSRFSAVDASSQIVNALFSLVLTAIIAFLFVTMAALMIVRLVALWILVIFVPLALVSWVIPAANKYWKMWWEKFFAWAFFPAIFGIFIYFALIIGNAFQTSIFTELGSATVEDSSWFTVAVQSFLQMLIVVFILFAGLKYARSAGLDGAGMVVKWSDKARNAALGQVQRPGKWAYNRSKEKIGEKKTSLVGAGLEKAFYRQVKDPKTGKVRLEARSGTSYLSETEHGRHVVGAANAKIRERRDLIRKKVGEYNKNTKDPHLLETDLAGKRGDDYLAAGLVAEQEGILQKLFDGGRITPERIAEFQDQLDELGMGNDFSKSFMDVLVEQTRRTVDQAIEVTEKMQSKDWERARSEFLPKLSAAVNNARPGANIQLHKRIQEKYTGNQIGKMLGEGQEGNLQDFERYVYNLVNPNHQRGAISRDEYIGYIRDVRNNPRLAKWLEKSPGGQEMFRDLNYVLP